MPGHAVPFLDSVWRASELSQGAGATVPSGHALLDAALPGGGWPCGSLTEVLQAQSGLHEWRLLLPALRAVVGTVVLVASPYLPNTPALACQGLATEALLRIDVERAADQLWTAEQALRCREVGAVLVWLASARSDQLRRLHMAAQSANQAQAPLVFAFRPLAVQQSSSPAPLRVQLGAAAGHGLALELLKRRGPTLGRPLHLQPALPPALVRQPSALPSHAVDRPRSFTRTITRI